MKYEGRSLLKTIITVLAAILVMLALAGFTVYVFFSLGRLLIYKSNVSAWLFLGGGIWILILIFLILAGVLWWWRTKLL